LLFLNEKNPLRKYETINRKNTKVESGPNSVFSEEYYENNNSLTPKNAPASTKKKGSSKNLSIQIVEDKEDESWQSPLSIKKESKNYTIINELGEGKYFGEISLLTNLPITATIHWISDVICGHLSKEAFLRFVDDFPEWKSQLSDTTKYNDFFFQSLHK